MSAIVSSVPARAVVVLAAALILAVPGVNVDHRDDAPPPAHLVTIDLGVALDTLVGAPFESYGVNGWLVRQADGSVDAFWARSPHRGCYVHLLQRGDGAYERMSEDFTGGLAGVFRDVCFGSTFWLTGERVFGPSPRDLDRFEVVARPDPETVVIDLGRVLLGDCAPAYEGDDCSGPGAPRRVPGPALEEWTPE